MPLWKKANGKLIKNAGGKLVDCATCPCDDWPADVELTCERCPEGTPIVFPGRLQIEFAATPPEAACIDPVLATDPTWKATAGTSIEVFNPSGVWNLRIDTEWFDDGCPFWFSDWFVCFVLRDVPTLGDVEYRYRWIAFFSAVSSTTVRFHARFIVDSAVPTFGNFWMLGQAQYSAVFDDCTSWPRVVDVEGDNSAYCSRDTPEEITVEAP